MQTRASAAQQEQNAETLRHLAEALDALAQAPAAAPPIPWDASAEDGLRPLLKTLVDLYDSVALAGRELQRAPDAVAAALRPVEDAAADEESSAAPPWWARLVGGRSDHRREARRGGSELRAARDSVERTRQTLAATAAGYAMTLQRVERAMAQHGLEPITAVGRPFDPDRMEALEVVLDSGRPSGEVVEEVRRGYLWQGASSGTHRCVWRRTVVSDQWSAIRATDRGTAPGNGICLADHRPLTTLGETVMDAIVGIDLGTTNSEVALVQNGQPHVFEEDGDPILPSFVGLAEDGRLLVGKAAKNQWVLAPERTIKSIKRKMGQDVKVKLGDQEYRPQEISAMILRALRNRAARSWAGRSRRRSSRCRPTSTTPSARPRARPANWPAWRSCASSTSRRPRR